MADFDEKTIAAAWDATMAAAARRAVGRQIWGPIVLGPGVNTPERTLAEQCAILPARQAAEIEEAERKLTPNDVASQPETFGIGPRTAEQIARNDRELAASAERLAALQTERLAAGAYKLGPSPKGDRGYDVTTGKPDSCPFCSGWDIKPVDYHGHGHTFLRCQSCFSSGPSGETLPHAVAAWNVRAGSEHLRAELRTIRAAVNAALGE